MLEVADTAEWLARRLAVARPLSWSPDASFRERDQGLGEEFSVSLFAPDGTLMELPGAVVEVLCAFGAGATVSEVAERLGYAPDDVPAVAELAATLGERGFLAAGPVLPARPSIAPVLLVTAHGCGGSLVRLLLDAHPQLSCPPPHRLGNSLRAMIDRAAQTDGFSALDLDRGQSLRTLGLSVDGVLGLHARLRQKDGWVWASRDHDLCLDFLDGLFGGSARYLFVVRHPFDAAESSAQRYYREGWQAARMIDEVARHDDPRVAYVYYWAGVLRRMRQFRTAHPDRVHVVRYEDVVLHPDEALAEVFAFVGVEPPSFELVAEAFARPRETLEGGWESLAFEHETKLRDDQLGLWRDWGETLRRELFAVVGGELKSWGYEV